MLVQFTKVDENQKKKFDRLKKVLFPKMKASGVFDGVVGLMETEVARRKAVKK
jgi:hypothetical protein